MSNIVIDNTNEATGKITWVSVESLESRDLQKRNARVKGEKGVDKPDGKSPDGNFSRTRQEGADRGFVWMDGGRFRLQSGSGREIGVKVSGINPQTHIRFATLASIQLSSR